MADSITHSQSLNVLLSHVDTLSFTICQPGPGSRVQRGREMKKPNLLCAVTLCHMDVRGSHVAARVPWTQHIAHLPASSKDPTTTKFITASVLG